MAPGPLGPTYLQAIFTVAISLVAVCFSWRVKQSHVRATFISDQNEIVYRWRSPPGASVASVLDTCTNQFGDGSLEFNVVQDVNHIAKWKDRHGSGKLTCSTHMHNSVLV